MAEEHWIQSFNNSYLHPLCRFQLQHWRMKQESKEYMVGYSWLRFNSKTKTTCFTLLAYVTNYTVHPFPGWNSFKFLHGASLVIHGFNETSINGANNTSNSKASIISLETVKVFRIKSPLRINVVYIYVFCILLHVNQLDSKTLTLWGCLYI